MNQRRRGFTLVEIMVAMALTLFILAILSEVFVTGADTFRTLKSIGDLNASLRNATTLIRSDLAADHFEGKRRLSDPRFWTVGPPEQGYFYLYQGPPPVGPDPLAEGFDADQIPSRRRVVHKIAFTVRANGTRQQDFFSASVPPNSPLSLSGNPDGRYQRNGVFSSQWMEVCYFLSPVSTGATADGTPLYALYRQQRLLVADNNVVNWGGGGNSVPVANLPLYQPVVSCMANPNNPGTIYFNSPADVTIPERRGAGTFTYNAATQALTSAFAPLMTNFQVTGDDLLLTDVISFDIKVLTVGGGLPTATDFGDLPAAGPYYYDTWSRRQDDVFNYSLKLASGNWVRPVPMAPSAAGGAVPAYRITALQITLRIWDPRTKLSRQISIVQEM
jgi:prepilin-type N-terminal cleavage/methylation domain-containing protein